jgi:hypothetical protein
MSVSSVSSSGNSYQPISANQPGQLRQSFKDLETSLQSNDLAGAQSAVSAVQQALQSSPFAQAAQGTGQTSAVGTDLSALSQSLSANDLSGAQTAFAKLQQDLQSARAQAGEGHHHHHHHSASGTQTAATSTTPPTTSVASSGIDVSA